MAARRPTGSVGMREFVINCTKLNTVLTSPVGGLPGTVLLQLQVCELAIGIKRHTVVLHSKFTESMNLEFVDDSIIFETLSTRCL